MPTVEELIQQGDLLLYQDQLEGAQACYARALTLDPGCAEALFSLGSTWSHRGEWARAQDYAERAVAADPGHRGAHYLWANARFAVEDHAGALEIFERIEPRPDEVAQRAQMGLLQEKLGRLVDAEASLRAALQQDPAYLTRFSNTAVYDYSPLYADTHHALARVLQRAGNTMEARLHYHLAKRVDPRLQLDTMYREIMAEHELENHPYFDAPERDAPAPEAPVHDRVRYLLELETYDELVEAARAVDIGSNTSDIAGLIHAAQAGSRLALAARFRVVGDVASGADCRDLFEALRTRGWQQLLELAEALAQGARARDEITLLASRIEIAPETAADLVVLIKRYIRLDPGTADALAFTARIALTGAGAAWMRAAGWYLEGTCAVANRRWRAGEAALQRCVALVEIAGEHRFAGEAFEELVRAQQQLDEPAAARAAADHYLAIATGRSGLDECRARMLVARLLEASGERDRAADHVRLALALARRDPAAAHMVEQLARISAAFDAPGEAPPRNPVAIAIQRASEAIDGGDVDAGLAILETQYARSLAAADRDDVIELLSARAAALADHGRFVEGKAAYDEALHLARRMAHRFDLWPLLLNASILASKAGDGDEAVALAEQGLVEARRARRGDREAETHERLSMLLLDSAPERAIDHYGQALEARARAARQAGDAATASLRDVAEAMGLGKFAEAAELCRQLMGLPDQPVGDWSVAATNLAICSYALGDHEDALALLEDVTERLATAGEPERAYHIKLRQARMVKQLGRPVQDELIAAHTLIDRVESIGQRRSMLVELATLAVECDTLELAERLVGTALEIMRAPSWRDPRDEMMCHTLHGRIWRAAARYADAVGAYERALGLARSLGDRAQEGMLRGWRAISYRYLHELDRAKTDYEAAIEIAETMGETGNATAHRFNMIPLLVERGDTDEAFRCALQVHRDASRDGPELLRGRAVTTLHSHFADRLDDALREEVDALLERAPAGDDPVVAGWASTVLAQRTLQTGSVAEAYPELGRVIAAHQASGDRYNEACALLNRARLIADVFAEQAIADIAAARSIAVAIEHPKLTAECDEQLLRVALHTGDAELVARQLDLLVPAWAALRRSLESDRDRVHYANQVSELVDWCARFYLDDDPARAFELFELGRAQGTRDLMAPAGEAAALDLEGIRSLLASLPRRAIALTLNVVGDEVIAMSFRPEQQAPSRHPCAMTRTDLDDLLREFHDEMHELGGGGAITWDRLAEPLLEGFDQAVEQDDLVVVVLDELLQGLPLAGVRLGQRTLVERAAHLYCPGFTVLADLAARQARRPARARITSLAIGVAFADEALAVNQILAGVGLTGNALPKDELAARVADSDIVHFSGHGHFDREAPLESGLELRTPSTALLRDILSVRDLSRWQISSSLVTLSACETGLGEVAASEFLGLGRNLLASGASAVLLTLWRVAPRTTLDFMIAFYSELVRRRDAAAAIDVSECLRVAQLGCRAAMSMHGWSAFKLVGWPWIPADASTGGSR